MSSFFESNGTRLFDPAGQRLYLCASEDSRFLDYRHRLYKHLEHH